MDDDEGPISKGETDQTTTLSTLDDERVSNASPKSSGLMKRKHDDETLSSSSSSASSLTSSIAAGNNTVAPVATMPSKSTLCSECGTMIQNSSNLVVHMRRHLQYKPHHCSLCDYQGYDADDVRRHALRDHSGQNCKVNHRSKIDMEAQVREMIQKCKALDKDNDDSTKPMDNVPPKSVSPEDRSVSSNESASGAGDSSLLNNFSHDKKNDSTGFLTKSSIFGGFPNATAGTVTNAATQFIMGPRGPDVLSGLLYAALSQMDLDSMKCGLCGESIPHNPVPIIRHLKVHSQFGGYACAYCDAHSKTVSDLEFHLLNAHSNNLDEEKTRAVLNSARKSSRREMTQLVETAFWGLGQMAKIKCSLCNEKILWRSSSLQAHLKEHVGYYPYKCLICTAPFVDHSGLIEHFTMQHSGTFPLLNFTADLKSQNEIDNTFEKCFPALSASFIEDLEPESRKHNLPMDYDGDSRGSNDNNSPMEEDDQLSAGGREQLDRNANPLKTTVNCNLCQAKISRNMSCLIAHAKVHLAYKPLKCEYCNFRHFAMSKIRRHNARVHNNKPVKVSYHPVQDIGKQIKDMKVKCFGVIAGPSAANQYVEQSDAIDDDDDCSDDNNNNDGALPVVTGLNQTTPLVTVADLLKGLISTSNPMLSPNAGGFLSPNNSKSSLKSDGSDVPYEGSGLGKKMCTMCNTYIANNPSSFENHACKHLDYKPYNCHYCQYQSYIRGKVTRHIQQVHNGLAVKIIHKPVPGIKDQIQRVKLQCFPFLSGTLEVGGLTLEALGAALTDASDGQERSGNGQTVILCKLCNNQVPTDREAMREHVEAHIVSKYYHCPVCTYQTTHLARAKQHMHSAHPQGRDQRILVCPADGPQGLQTLKISCFGVSAGYPGLKANLFGGGEQTMEEILAKQQKQQQQGESDEEPFTCEGNREIMDDDDSDDVPLPVSTGDEEIIECGDEMPMDQDDGKLQCVLCSEMVVNQPTALNLHVHQHVDYKPYQCSFCNWKSSNEIDVKHHILGTHKNAPTTVIYHPEKALINKVHQKCFPSVSLITVIKGESSRADSPANLAISNVAQGNISRGGSQGHSIAASFPSSSSNLLRRLVCKLCNGTIADNPKSVGIHVKNHLNYKPYRCPLCRYMSCEQSKARRHVEHVHTVNGDAIQIHAEENIKEKISEMKSRCFPNLGQMGLMDVYGNSSNADAESMGPPTTTTAVKGSRIKSQLETFKEDSNVGTPGSADDDEISNGQMIFQCGICKEPIPVESADHHVRTHLGKPYKCAYCSSRFSTDDKVKQHVQSIHPYSPPRSVFQGGDLESQFGIVKKKCFPELSADEGFVEQPDEDNDGGSMNVSTTSQLTISRVRSFASSSSTNAVSRKMVTPVDGRLACMVCEQWVSMNPNSLDVHVKNHLEFKPHSCAYCSYKSCIAGKVKRHLESVHRGREPKILSFSQTSQNLKQIIADMRTLCFPMMEGDVQTRSRLQTSQNVEQLRVRMVKELKYLVGEAAAAAADVNDMMIYASNFDDVNGVSSDQLDNSSYFIFGEGENDEEWSGIENGCINGTKLTCAVCLAQIADNPSSLGLHVRNHLDYKPFHCNLCDYKSCIQAKVKRHLRNVHKCTTNQMTHEPLPDIRVKVTEMKLRCFPRMVEAMDLAAGGKTGNVNDNGNEFTLNVDGGLEDDGLDADDIDDDVDELKKIKNVWDKSDSLKADASAFINVHNYDVDGEDFENETKPNITAFSVKVEDIECQICGERVSNDHLSKTKHLTKHLGDYEYRCQYCDYASFVQHETMKHLATCHQGQPIRVTRVNTSGKQISAAYERLTEQCFPALTTVSNENKISNGTAPISATSSSSSQKGDALVCALCDKTLSANDETALELHVYEHKNRNHYKCPHCSFAHCQNGVVKEHCRNVHPDMSMKIMTMGADTKGDESVWRTKCFPTKNAEVSTVGLVKEEIDALEDLEDFDEEDDELAEGSPNKLKSSPRNAAPNDGPRYVCQICKSPVSMYASSLYVHVKNHMNYKPYCCGHCDYKSPVKSKVRRHIQNQHKNMQEIINYFPTPGIDHEVLRWKKKCFPEVTSFATLANDKVPCLLCKTDVADTLLSKSVHAKNHLDAKPYHCGYCSYKSCLRGETRRHVVRQHAGVVVNIEFRNDEVAAKEDVDVMIERCFVTGEPIPEPVVPVPINLPKAGRSSKVVVNNTLISTINNTNNTTTTPSIIPTVPSTSVTFSDVTTNEITEPTTPPPTEKEPPTIEEPPKPVATTETSSNAVTPKSEQRKASRHNVSSSSSTPVSNSPTSGTTTAKSVVSSPSGYNLRTNRSSSTIGIIKSLSTHSGGKSTKEDKDNSVKLGQAYREWYCCYCLFKAHSKYVVKQHCLTEHPGKPVEVSDQNRVNKK